MNSASQLPAGARPRSPAAQPTPTGRIGLVLHPGRDPIPAAGTVARWTQSNGADVLIGVNDAERCPTQGVRTVAADELARCVDLLVSVGGDETMLGALRLAAQAPVPCWASTPGAWDSWSRSSLMTSMVRSTGFRASSSQSRHTPRPFSHRKPRNSLRST